MIKSFLKIALTAFVVATLAFVSLRIAPGDPVERILGPNARMEQIQDYRERLGLNLPLTSQYMKFLRDFVQLNWGDSLFKNKPVLELISDAMTPTIKLALISVLIAFILASVIGVLAAIFRATILDHIIRVFTLSILSFPIFSLAPILIILFSIKLNWLPVSELNSLKHYFLPLMCLSLPMTCVLSRVIRNQYLETLHEPWIVVLKAKGMGALAIILRIYKVCLPTVINVVSLQLSVVLAGAMITETIFDIPGLGRLLLQSLENRDYPLVQGLIIYTSVIYLSLYAVNDYINRKIDPRLGIE